MPKGNAWNVGTEPVVSLNVLQEACRRVSGTCHRFDVETSRNRAYLTYSNPDEYASEFPMTAVLPLWVSDWPEKDYATIVLTILRVKNDNWNGEGWQAFDGVLDVARRLTRGREGEWLLTSTFYTDRLDQYPCGSCPDCGGTIAKLTQAGGYGILRCAVCHSQRPVQSLPFTADATVQEVFSGLARIPAPDCYSPWALGPDGKPLPISREWKEGDTRR
jgi:hypothetical protein